jgi:hypothetical protein
MSTGVTSTVSALQLRQRLISRFTSLDNYIHVHIKFPDHKAISSPIPIHCSYISTHCAPARVVRLP